MDDILKQLLEQEQELQFTNFNEAIAWQLGSRMVEQCRQDGLPVAIDITMGTRQLFHSSLKGASTDNDEWVKRKVRLVYRFGHSSFYMGHFLKSKGRTLKDLYLLDESEYAAHGGCFPVIVKGTGMVGTITVSGLPQEEDHKLVVDSIRAFLAKEQ